MKTSHCKLVNVPTCTQGTTVQEAAKALREAKQRRILVLDEKKTPVGIVSTTDMNNKVVAEALDFMTKVDTIMSTLHLVADIDTPITDVYDKMVEKQSFFVPVTENGAFKGVLTYGEIVHHVKESIYGN